MSREPSTGDSPGYRAQPEFGWLTVVKQIADARGERGGERVHQHVTRTRTTEDKRYAQAAVSRDQRPPFATSQAPLCSDERAERQVACLR